MSVGYIGGKWGEYGGGERGKPGVGVITRVGFITKERGRKYGDD